MGLGGWAEGGGVGMRNRDVEVLVAMAGILPFDNRDAAGERGDMDGRGGIGLEDPRVGERSVN